MKSRLILFLFVLVLLPLDIHSQTPITNQPQKKIALVIGNGNYSSSVLANPENDARAIKVALQSVGFTVMEYENLNQNQMKKAIDDFGVKLENADVGLFYYAGHGIQSKGYNYLIPTDAQLQSEQQVEYDCVQADRVLALMEASSSKVNILILDACRNNPFERSWTRSETGKGLAFMNAPKGTLIAYATSPGSTASDGSGEHGLYTSAILESIIIPNITIIQMFQEVRSIVQILNRIFEVQIRYIMKTASELKIFKANGYEYIYIYYKQNCLIRINTKYTFVKNGMTKENLYKNTVPDYKNKNEHISLLKKRTDKYISDHLLSSSQSGKINQKEAYNAAFNLNPTYIDHAGNKLLLPIYNTFVSDLNKEKHYQPKTIIYYNNLKNHIEEYEKDVIKHKLTLSDFNTKTSLIDFCNFLGEKRGMNDNSIAKRLVTLKSFLNYCIGEGIYNYDATVFSYKIQKYETDVVALNLDELQNLIYLKNDNPSWQKIIDVFVCNCFMGLRISDLSRLSKADFSMDEDGDYKYTSKNKKTGTTVMIPIIEIPLTILKKYDFNLPSYTGQYFNRQLQKILTHYKLFEDEIITRREVFKKETESKVMKRTKITSHTCRKSFITFCIMSQIPLNVIMKASGHKQIQTMQAYVLKTPDKEQFKKLNKKTREVMKDERLKREREQVEIENLKDPTHSL